MLLYCTIQRIPQFLDLLLAIPSLTISFLFAEFQWLFPQKSRQRICSSWEEWKAWYKLRWSFKNSPQITPWSQMKALFMHVTFLHVSIFGNLVSKLQPIKMSLLWKGTFGCTGFSGWFYFWVHEGVADVNGQNVFKNWKVVSETFVKGYQQHW